MSKEKILFIKRGDPSPGNLLLWAEGRVKVQWSQGMPWLGLGTWVFLKVAAFRKGFPGGASGKEPA